MSLKPFNWTFILKTEFVINLDLGVNLSNGGVPNLLMQGFPSNSACNCTRPAIIKITILHKRIVGFRRAL